MVFLHQIHVTLDDKFSIIVATNGGAALRN
jgi:hypothetical protein